MSSEQAEPVDPKPSPPQHEREQRTSPVVIEAAAIETATSEQPALETRPTPVADGAVPPVADSAPAPPSGATPASPRKISRVWALPFALALLAGGFWAAWQWQWGTLEPGMKETAGGPQNPALDSNAGREPAVVNGADSPAPTPRADDTALKKAESAAPVVALPKIPVAPAVPETAPVAAEAKSSTAEPRQQQPQAPDAGFEQRLAKLESDLLALPPPQIPAPPVDMQPILGRLATLEKRVQSLEDAGKATKSAIRATEPAAIATPRQKDPAALATVAQAIERAIDTGAPFAPALAAARALGATESALAPLQSVAKNGAPTAAALAKLFSDSQTAVLTATEPPDTPDATPFDRLTALTSKLVRVHPVGEPRGDDPKSIVVRIESALTHGAIGAAFADWMKLPAAAQEAARGFGEQARLRLAADDAARALSALAISQIVNGPANTREQP